MVARLSFRLSQSDLNNDERPLAIRNVPDPSNLQEKQEERRNLLSRMARQRDADSRTAELSITHTRQETFVDEDDEAEDEKAGDDYVDDHASVQEDDYGYVPPMISFCVNGGNTDGDEESAITDACTWTDMSTGSIGSRCAAGDVKVLPSEIQNAADEDNVSCLYDGSGSFRLAKPPSSGHRFRNSITRSASGKSILDSSFVLLTGDDTADSNVWPGADMDKGDKGGPDPPSVSLFHESPSRRGSYPKMKSLLSKTIKNMEFSDGSLYLDDDPGNPKANAQQKFTDGNPVVGVEEVVIPGDTMDDNFYLAEIVKALEEQNRKTKLLYRKAQNAKKAKQSDSYLLEL
jgi:hypothetical protein